ncbi:MAG: helix-turn-helix domain-containing protein [Pseudomonadota bacterium]
MTSDEFKEARLKLGLSLSQLAAILATDPRTIRKWEATSGTNARNPNPVAAQAMHWMLAGFRPPEWPQKSDAPSGARGTETGR